MSIANYNIVTSAGLNFVTSAHDSGPLIAIKYFLPVYDYRIDPQIHNGSDTVTMDLSASVSATDTSPFGEQIYNDDTGTYSLTTTDDFVLSAGGESLDDSGNPWILTNSVMSKEQKVNLANGIPLSNYISGTEVNSSATSNAWTIYSGARVVGSNSAPVATTAKYFEVVDYYPVLNANVIKGSFKCRLNKAIGTVKFNKLGLYVVQVDSNGNDISDPALFAEAVLSSPIIKESYGTSGFEDIVMDIQIQIGSITTNFSDVFFATSADYWNRSPGGVYYPENVGIGMFQDDVQAIQAKCQIRTSATDQLRLDYDASTSGAFNVTSAGNLAITMAYGKSIYPTRLADLGNRDYYFNRSHVIQNVTYSLSGCNDSNIGLYNSIIPSSDGTIDLGSESSKFDEGYFNNLSGTSNLYGYDVTVGNSIKPSKRFINIGNYGSEFGTLYIDSINNSEKYRDGIEIMTSLVPLGNDQVDLGTSTNVYGDIHAYKAYLNRSFSEPTGKWLAMGWLQLNGISWNAATGYDFFETASVLYNQTQWSQISITDIVATVIGSNTLVMKFDFNFTKSSVASTSRSMPICQIVPNADNDDSVALRTLRNYNVSTATDSVFPFSSVTGGSDFADVSLAVEYSNRATNFNPDFGGGWKFTIINRGGGDSQWRNQTFKTSVTLIHEMMV